MSDDSATTDVIEEYLDRLLGELRGDPRQIRRILTEIEGHLHDAVEAGMADGLTEQAAQQRAVERCGAPTAVAKRFAAEHPGRLVSFDVVRQLARAAVFLVAVGLIAIGVSGGVAQMMGSTSSARFVAGDAPGFVNPPSRCDYYLEYYPQGSTCSGAAALHHFDEVVMYRVAAGLLGLVLMAACAWERRRRRSLERQVLPDAFVATIGATVFTAAGVFLLLFSFDQWKVNSSSGMGQYLSGGVVALPVGIAFGISLLRSLARRAASAVVV
ncbi:MAG TPA: permease prefix domain 1-containing protein [Acidimicrobiales bacterium]|nr:permease prefix domain 1-containing protein [Acidimicrobiales bacterium]